MIPILTHRWDLTPDEAVKLQERLAPNVIPYDDLGSVELIAGVDVAYQKARYEIIAGVAVLQWPSLEVVERQVVSARATFPYVPGLFAFRELPALVSALAQLRNQPDLIICDGQGLAHPRRFGLASHLGVLFDVPTIGCAKTRLIGSHTELPEGRGSTVPLIDHGVVVGAVLRTQPRTRPVYVSVGHRLALSTACSWVLQLSSKYRLPETTRAADQIVKEAMRNFRRAD